MSMSHAALPKSMQLKPIEGQQHAQFLVRVVAGHSRNFVAIHQSACGVSISHIALHLLMQLVSSDTRLMLCVHMLATSYLLAWA